MHACMSVLTIHMISCQLWTGKTVCSILICEVWALLYVQYMWIVSDATNYLLKIQKNIRKFLKEQIKIENVNNSNH